MPSTYSPLKIQLMATGENNTTWGNVTNTNLGIAIEEAIVGSEDVTFASANVTLTLTDTNASQTARNLRLRCTGTTGGSTRNLVVPSIEKPYIVQNDCADSILVKTTAGNGITVPAGKTMWVYNNGTDVVDATSHLSSLTLGTALPVLSGGTGSNSASGARTNLGATTVGANLFTLANPGAITFPRLNADNSVSTLAAAAFRTAIGSTTLGDNLYTITNPNAVTFPRFNVDNTVSALSAADMRTAIGASSGTVTSVSGAGTVNGLTLTGTVTSTGNLTLGGTLSGVDLTSQVTGTLPVANGGTGGTTQATARSGIGAAASGTNTDITTMNPAAGLQIGTPTDGAKGAGTINATGLFVNGVAVGTSTGTVSSVGGTGTVNGITLTGTVTSTGNLTLGGTLSDVSLTTQVTGTLPIGNGGTNATTAGGARTQLGATTLGGNLFTITNPDAVTFPRFNLNNTVSALNAADFRTAIGAGTVTSVGGTGTVNGLTLTGTVTSAGSLTLGGSLSGVDLTSQVTGTLPVANGGTGQTTYTNGQLLIGNTTGNTLTKATLTAGSGIEITNAAGAITITSTAGGGSVTSVDVSGGTTGLTTSGGPITGAGTITFAGTLAVANGGTGSTTAGDARTALGATTVGGNMFTLANPGAVTFPRFNADNTVSALSASDFRTAIGAGTGSGDGTVTSVGMSVPAFLSVDGSPITSSGTLAVTLSGTALPVANGGTGATTLTGILKGDGVSAFTAATAGTDFVAPGGALGTPSSGTLTNCTFPTLNQSTTGSAGSVANAITFDNTGGALPGTTFNGSAARIIDYGTVGAAKADGTGATGTWPISISGSAASATSATTAGNVSGTVAVANGGTGATTLPSTFLIKGNGTSAVSASVVFEDIFGRVGISTGVAFGKFSVQGSTTAAAAITGLGGSVVGNYVSADLNNGDKWNFGRDNVTTGNFVHSYNGTVLTSITTSGRVGIGTTGPTSALDVVGGIKTSRTAVTAPAATDGNIFSGTYTPTLTNVNRVDISNSTAYACQYMRVGDVVTVSGKVDIGVTATGITQLNMTLPIASNFSASENCAGTAYVLYSGISTNSPAGIMADATNDTAQLYYFGNVTGAAQTFVFTFTYRII